MKKTIKLIAIGATIAMLSLPAAAKSLLSMSDTVIQDQCTEENKTAWYAAFRADFKTDQAKAYEAAKKYLTACSTEDTQISQYLKKFVAAYDKEYRKVRLPQLIYNDKKYPEAFALGKELLAEEPDNVKVLVDLGYAGYLAATTNNKSFTADAINYAKKAIQLIESGKTVDNWAPFGNKDEALAYLNYSIGVLTLPQDATSALTYLIKAAQYESNLKKLPFTYAYIAGAYETGPYAKQSADYKTTFGGKDETPESKLALANVNQIVDRMIDAYARAVAAAGSDPKFQTNKPEWVESLATWYKYRHQSDAGMNELVASVLSKPLPPEPTPLTSLPAASTPAAGTGAAATPPAAGSTTGAAATKPGTAPASTPTPTPKTTGTKPATASVPGKPKSNHR
jgi:hypothetical protein